MKPILTSSLNFGLAFVIIAILFSSASGQLVSDNPTLDPRYKDENISLILGIIVVGGGHFYSGETGTGALLLGTAIAAPIIGYAVGTDNVDDAFDTGDTSSITGPVYAGIAVSIGVMIYSIIDSPKAARRTNVKNGLAWRDTIQFTPSLLATSSQQTGYGVTMKVNF